MALGARPQNSLRGLRNTKKKSSGVVALLVCLAVSIGLFTVSARGGETGFLNIFREAFQTVTSPVRYVGTAATMPFKGISNIFANLTADQGTLSELKAENAQLRTRNAELEEAGQTAERLQKLLGLQNAYKLQATAARIISGATDSWSSTVTIDKGSSSGLSVGMPVTSSSGVIGQIVSCSATTSTVRLITDESSNVSAMIQSSRAQGMLKGSASGLVMLDMIRTDQSVEVGNTVVTSGLGGVYPKGLPLGKVTSVERNPGSMYYTIVVDTFANVENFEEVLVITSLSEDQVSNASDVAEADSQETSAPAPENPASAGGADPQSPQGGATGADGSSAKTQ